MKKLIAVQEVEGEGLVGLLGKRVLILCSTYFYAGILEGVNKDSILLKDASIVYDTGSWSYTGFQDAQKLPGPLYIQVSMIESFMETNKR